MKFEQVGPNEQMVVEETVNVIYALKIFCKRLLNGIKVSFDAKDAVEKFGIEFFFQQSLDSQIKSPFGNARGSMDIQIFGEEIFGRYVFEKSVVSERGEEIWVPVWALRIDRFGNVILGDEGTIEIDAKAINPRDTAFTAVARSLLYRMGITPKFK
ncbi:hypothetical protein [Pseudomonas fluorescens]|uniref:hypothetical protein n=1 Tax=Pseudomonas fluorescens TaxID=294 RepID=UPI0012420FF2|nr:hypothetical protein [Pseudomonas fluorescens]VVO85171.1 hypothetical protein PS898_02017 [Pseudomonas fluorescens]